MGTGPIHPVRDGGGRSEGGVVVRTLGGCPACVPAEKLMCSSRPCSRGVPWARTSVSSAFGVGRGAVKTPLGSAEALSGPLAAQPVKGNTPSSLFTRILAP